eukprot:TRINITY_DN7476_c0_g1_i1.p1 TRINITY_DN7476_c0_g1~~TRINITY_DN7476_c0_g1_i1.p1  ORF type:complete len:108 (+),score=22.93 TRINITY_DN7476_c0_g1_i1:137-460(+)
MSQITEDKGRIQSFVEVEVDFHKEDNIDIEKLNDDIQVLAETFKDVNKVVQKQGEALDVEEEKTKEIVVNVEEGTKELKKASEYHRSSRNYCIVAIVVTVIIIIIVQ